MPAGNARMNLTRQQLTVLILALGTTSMGQSLVFAILQPLGREVRLSELQITSIVASSALLFSFASPRWGRLSDRLGRKQVMIIGLLGYTVGTLLFTSVFYAGLVGALAGLALYLVLLVARCSQGIVMSATGPASTAYAADHTAPENRLRALAKLGTANSLGTIIGPAVSGALATLGLLAPLYFAGTLAALAALLVWRKLPPTPEAQRVSRVASSRLRLRDPRIANYLLAGVGTFIGFSGIQQTLGFQLQDKLALDGIATAQMVGAALMVSALMTFFSQMVLVQRLQLHPQQFILAGLGCLLFGSLFVAAFETFAVLGVGMGFLGLGVGLILPAVGSGASLAVGPAEQGAVAGLVSACPAFGFVVGPVVAGGLYQVHPPLAPLFSGAVFALLLLILTLRLRVTSS
jgi:MFS family permease